ncbi:MAG TPA: phosphonate C-P lyase system protein PhnH [Clostridiales bacterium]|nr:phosphonate C-P lyase system protein PhnH [Clostridiales bacterium]
MIDLVHDIAESYRKIVDAFSRPGEIMSIEKNAEKNDIDSSFYDSTIILVYMFLDAEVNYSLVEPEPKDSTDLISKLTYSNEAKLDNADYIFISLNAQEKDKAEALIKSKVGSLKDPHKSATLIFEIDNFDKGNCYEISGPGILGKNKIYVDLFKNWDVLRNEKTKEFPLGIDIILVDKFHNIMVIPRTTILKGSDI